MRMVLFTLLVVAGVLLTWLVGAASLPTGSNTAQQPIADMWRRPVINITESRPAPSWTPHPLCSDPLMPLALRIGIRCTPPPPVMFSG